MLLLLGLLGDVEDLIVLVLRNLGNLIGLLYLMHRLRCRLSLLRSELLIRCQLILWCCSGLALRLEEFGRAVLALTQSHIHLMIVCT